MYCKLCTNLNLSDLRKAFYTFQKKKYLNFGVLNITKEISDINTLFIILTKNC